LSQLVTEALLDQLLAPEIWCMLHGNLSAMASRIHFILGVAGQYAISAAIKAIFECE